MAVNFSHRSISTCLLQLVGGLLRGVCFKLVYQLSRVRRGLTCTLRLLKQQSPTTVPFRTTLTRTITLYKLFSQCYSIGDTPPKLPIPFFCALFTLLYAIFFITYLRRPIAAGGKQASDNPSPANPNLCFTFSFFPVVSFQLQFGISVPSPAVSGDSPLSLPLGIPPQGSLAGYLDQYNAASYLLLWPVRFMITKL